ncbi:MAG: hypothetical protein QW701_03495 [Candidatus Nezhaarchaeales archaeon]
MNSKFKVSDDVVELTSKLIRLVIEIEDYWRKSSPLHELEEGDIKEILKLFDEAEELISKIKERLCFKP